ncbi:major facilitator superfamily MFS_1 [Cucurbitaria berberidis CBS 394.84]|uniref:Major facilitator superfamily MFS_1 n=1 Tax=Cucurbitaria berberidis CBS 394.84 TaxID=1168544 RepID=A0A9P4L8D7_9PLEO|nr:major facilitator superfamily MFS_1 [Cucurbitaria berberidis CBS 394.84]KAF1845153.1 major facilitator superfamily MFS_1 [Cucurbitaria berberidis CBS 394.84]
MSTVVKPESNPTPLNTSDTPKPKGLAFWLVIFSLCLIAFTSSLDGSIIAIALPEISTALSSDDKYIGIANCFVLAQTVVQPAFAQFCDVFGRRWPMITAVVIFAVGSGIAGGANDTTTMIAGRTIQGLGSGGIMLMVELIVCDLVPLKERGTYLGVVLSVAALGAIAGPIVGGALAEKDWRWCFFINLPICALVLPILVVFLRIRHHKISWSQLLTRIDWTGNVIFIGSICALLLGLVYGGTIYPWSSWRIITPLVLGTMGWVGFHFYETKCQNPCVPPRVFANRTSSAAFYMIFVTSMALQWVCFFWPVYFMAVRGTSLMGTGVNFMPFMFLLIPGSAVAGIILSKTGHYRRLHLIGFVLSTIGPGLNTLLTADTHAGIWATFQIIDAVGRAMILPTTLPAALAALTEEDVAAATGVYSFLRSFGYVWGVTIPGIIFNNYFDRNRFKISDPTVREALKGGSAYQFATGPFIHSLPIVTRTQVFTVYLSALKAVWFAAMAFGASGFIAVALEKHVPLRTSLDTQYGLDAEGKRQDMEVVNERTEKERE